MLVIWISDEIRSMAAMNENDYDNNKIMIIFYFAFMRLVSDRLFWNALEANVRMINNWKFLGMNANVSAVDQRNYEMLT